MPKDDHRSFVDSEKAVDKEISCQTCVQWKNWRGKKMSPKLRRVGTGKF